MADLIDRDELKKRYIATAQSGGYLGDAMYIAINHLTRLLRLIDKAPTVEPKKGRWIDWSEVIGGQYHEVCECSNCHFTTDRLCFTDFCPNCGSYNRGANMRGGSPDE